ncbi:MAG: hypothetical protein ACKVOQ_16475 [Cyclobacteriaceae bacterium]
MNRVFDCFSFFNELDILEVRLNELNDVVDFFVLVEAKWTHQNKEKPLYYELNKKRFAKFHSKIRHIILEEKPDFFYSFRKPKSWDFERYQKDQIRRGLSNCDPEDIIILSDVDEIPNPLILKSFKDFVGTHVFQQRIYHYFINCLEVEKDNQTRPNWWYGSVMTRFKNFKSAKKLRLLREIHKYHGSVIIPDAGWHFTSLGGVEKIIRKLESFAHTEFNNPDFKDPNKIQKLIENGESVFDQDIKCVFTEIDVSFPLYVQNNREKLKNYIFKHSNV